MVPNIHQVQKQYLHVELVGTEADGLSLQYSFPRLCQNTLMPALDRMLERIVPADEYWLIDRLEIDAGVLALDKLESELVEAVVRETEKQLRMHAVSATLAGVSESEQSTINSVEANAAILHREDASAGPSGRMAQTIGKRPCGQELPVDPTDVTGSIRRRTEAQSIHDTFLHFLKTGSLPWWFQLPSGSSFEQAVQGSWGILHASGESACFRRGMAEVMRFAAVRKRLVQQFSADFLLALLHLLAPENAQALRELLVKLGNTAHVPEPLRLLCTELWQTALAEAAAGNRHTEATLVAACWKRIQDQQLPAEYSEILLAGIAPGNGQAEAKSRQDTKGSSADALADGISKRPSEQMERLDLKEGIYIHCAGLVLLHPFLPQFFESLGIAKEGRLLQPERAVCLLHYLATGQDIAPEYELQLPKLLCGIPFETPVPSMAELAGAETEEAAALLGAVIKHWEVLHDTSPDGLRGTFLMRPGKLTERSDGDCLLQVETQSFDILLDTLPWGIGAVKLPWMPRMLWVEWRQ